jgi:hypothetical protein
MSLKEAALMFARDKAAARARSCPPHAWDCPVLTKLDPLAITWTCARCGHLMTTPVGAPRPDGNAIETLR